MAYFEVCRRIRLRDHSLQMKATKQDFVMVLFTVLYKVAHTFQSVDERKSSRLNWDHSNETYWAILSNTILFIIVVWMKSQGKTNIQQQVVNGESSKIEKIFHACRLLLSKRWR